MPDINTIIAYLKEAQIPAIPCSDAEINLLEAHYQLQLPADYRRFLAYCGKDAGLFMRGTDAFYSFLYDITGGGRELLQEHGRTLPEKAFVFWMHQGYQFAWFICDGNQQPKVYYLDDTQDDLGYREYDSLPDFLFEELIHHGILTSSAT